MYVFQSHLGNRDFDLHHGPHNLVAFLEQLDALQGLSLRWLVELDREVDGVHGSLNRFDGEVPAVGGVHALLRDDRGDVGEHVRALQLALFVADLQLAWDRQTSYLSRGWSRLSTTWFCSGRTCSSRTSSRWFRGWRFRRSRRIGAPMTGLFRGRCAS